MLSIQTCVSLVYKHEDLYESIMRAVLCTLYNLMTSCGLNRIDEACSKRLLWVCYEWILFLVSISSLHNRDNGRTAREIVIVKAKLVGALSVESNTNKTKHALYWIVFFSPLHLYFVYDLFCLFDCLRFLLFHFFTSFKSLSRVCALSTVQRTNSTIENSLYTCWNVVL